MDFLVSQMASLRISHPPHFPFLALPPELRIVVYEHIGIEFKRHTLTQAESGLPDRLHNSWPSLPQNIQSSITAIRPSLHISLLRTCRLIYNEATPYLAPKLQDLERQPIHFVVDYCALVALTTKPCPLGNFAFEGIHGPPANEAVKAFTASCRPFILHKQKAFRSSANAPVGVRITITQDYRDVPENIVDLGFLRLSHRRTSLGVVFSVAWKKVPSTHSAWLRIWERGGLPPLAWDQHLRYLETLR